MTMTVDELIKALEAFRAERGDGDDLVFGYENGKLMGLGPMRWHHSQELKTVLVTEVSLYEEEI